MKKQRGITLISLVVTIIVLIILAGVSINLILGQDGIITKAKQAKENMELAQIEEQEQLNELYSQMTGESIGSTSNDAITKLTEFKKALADYIESKNVDRPEIAGDASVYINRFEEVLALASKVVENEAATAEDINTGKKAWVNGKLITGNKTENVNQNVVGLQMIDCGEVMSSYVTTINKAKLAIAVSSGSYKNGTAIYSDGTFCKSINDTSTGTIDVTDSSFTWKNTAGGVAQPTFIFYMTDSNSNKTGTSGINFVDCGNVASYNLEVPSKPKLVMFIPCGDVYQNGMNIYSDGTYYKSFDYSNMSTLNITDTNISWKYTSSGTRPMYLFYLL